MKKRKALLLFFLLVLFTLVFSADYQVVTVVGGSIGDGFPATEASLNWPMDIWVTQSGEILFADYLYNRARKISSDGIISTIAGNGQTGGNADNIIDGMLATSATLGGIHAVCEANGWYYIVVGDHNHVYKVDPVTLQIYHFLGGTGPDQIPTDGMDPLLAKIGHGVDDVFSDSQGNIYVTSCCSNWYDNGIPLGGALFKVDTNNYFSVLCGLGTNPIADGLPAKSVLMYPRSGCTDSEGNIYLIAHEQFTIWQIKNDDAKIYRFAGDGTQGDKDGCFRLDAQFGEEVLSVSCDAYDNIYVMDRRNVWLRKIDHDSGYTYRIAGNQHKDKGFGGDGGLALDALFGSFPFGAAVAPNGDAYICDAGNQRIRKVSTANGIISTFAGGGIGDGNPPLLSSLSWPNDVWVEPNGDIFIADWGHHLVRKYDRSLDVVETMMGTMTGNERYYPGIHPLDLFICEPTTICVIGDYLYVGDSSGSCGSKKVYRLHFPTNTLELFAGGGDEPPSGKFPEKGDRAADVYIGWYFHDLYSDLDNNLLIFCAAGRPGVVDGAIFRVNPDTNIILDIYGMGSLPLAEDNPAELAGFNPIAGCMDSKGNIYFLDSTIGETNPVYYWRISLEDSSNPDYGLLSKHSSGNAWYPHMTRDIECDRQGNIFLTDYRQVRKVDTQGNVSVVSPPDAFTAHLYGIHATPRGDIYVCDSAEDVIKRLIKPNSPPIVECKDVTVDLSDGSCSIDISIDDNSFDPDGDEITLNQDPPGPYFIGEHHVVLTVSDGEFSEICEAVVTVSESVPPTATIEAIPATIWPPNNKMIDIHISLEAFDNCDSDVDVILKSITCNEPLEPVDIAEAEFGTEDYDFKLRAKRIPKKRSGGREYLITYELTDHCGNSNFVETIVRVLQKIIR